MQAMKLKLRKLVTAIALLGATASAGAAEFWTYIPGNGQLSVNNPGGGAGFASVSVTGYGGVGGQFNGNFWDAGVKPADSFFRFFCIELGEHANTGPNPYRRARSAMMNCASSTTLPTRTRRPAISGTAVRRISVTSRMPTAPRHSRSRSGTSTSTAT